MNDRSNKRLIAIFSITLLLLTISGVTFAYFSSNTPDPKQINVNGRTSSAGDLTQFLISGNLNIAATEYNFQRSGGDLASEVTAKVIFAPGTNDDSGSDMCYTVKVQVAENNFNYTESSLHPELVLQAKYNDVTTYSDTSSITINDTGLHEYSNDIDTVKYVTVPAQSANTETGYAGRSTAINGYDITTNTSTFNIPYQLNNNIFKIHANNGEKVEQYWIFKINFINYDWDQADSNNPNNNGNKTFNGKIIFEKVDCN